MDCLCDEILQLIFYELHDPTPFTLLSKRLYRFSQDPYARAHYFLKRHGPAQAIFHALGRGKVLTEGVLDILITSGAHLSRYLVQIAIHHYFFTQSHFIKTRWVRNVPFPVFVHFLQLGSTRYGEIPREKGQDDGSLFSAFVRERSYPPNMRSTSWETIKDILENYNFIPFSSKDPIMAQFPLALAIEPRLLPYAVANGFYMDEKYRNFVFRKMFENISTAVTDRTADAIVQNVRELYRLDPSMFLSRTVAGEICMESKYNEAGYTALKVLAKSGDLLFDLPTLVQDLIKLFMKSRSITSAHTQANLCHLFADFPSSDPMVRLVMLLTTFLSVEPGSSSQSLLSLTAKLESLNLAPLTLEDILNLFLHPFMERHTLLLEYLKKELVVESENATDEVRKGMSQDNIKSVVEKLAIRLLETDCKGKLLKFLHDDYGTVRETVIRTVMDHDVKMENLPDSEDTEACTTYRANLCRDNGFYAKPPDSAYFWSSLPASEAKPSGDEDTEDEYESKTEIENVDDVSEGSSSAETTLNLGVIGQSSLATMITQEELFHSRSRRRLAPFFINHDHFTYFPNDCFSVAKWVKSVFGPKSSMTAIFMKHAVLNDNTSALRSYLHDSSSTPVPITLKHFELLAHLGQAPSFTLFAAIQGGAEFYRGEEDYVDPKRDYSLRTYKGKSRTFSHSQVEVVIERPSPGASSSSGVGKKRPRRSAATKRSYAIPDSGDEDLDAMVVDSPEEKVIPKKIDHLQLWVQHLGDLQKMEQAKFRERRKRAVADQLEVKTVAKTEFLKSLSSNLRTLRKYAEEKRKVLEIPAAAVSDDDDNDPDYTYKSPPTKKKRFELRT